MVSSPLRGAAATARAIAEATGATLSLDRRLVEVDFGDISGLRREEVASRYPEIAEARRANRPWPARPGEEKAFHLRRRMVAALEDVLAALDEGGTAAVVSHGVALDSGLRGLLGIDPPGWRLFGFDNAAIACLEVDGQDADRVFRLLSLNDRAHLPEAATEAAHAEDPRK